MASKPNGKTEKNEKNEKNEEIKTVTAGQTDEKAGQTDEKAELVRIKALVRIRADFGAFDAGHTYTVENLTAEKLIKSGRAEKCS